METQNAQNKYEIISRHYYGNTIRTIFLLTGVLMLVTFPFFSDLVPVPLPVSIGIMVLLVVFGGLLNPAQKWVLFMNTLIPLIGFIVFEYQAAYSYTHLTATETRGPAFFWVNQVISLLFFIAAYLSVKTARGRVVKDVD